MPKTLMPPIPAGLPVLAAMITPALLITACGTFILSTSQRMGRVAERVRLLSRQIEELMKSEPKPAMFEERRAMLAEQMQRVSGRLKMLARALTIFYLAGAMFIATSVALGIVSLLDAKYTWVPVTLGIAGACLLFYGSIMMIFEARLTLGALHSEMGFLSRLVSHHAEKRPRPK